ncbi:hypothetical protein B0H19DRAFT_1196371 [Mycena capillaripes]|nr:hypothetical protein B0H19DRAFT_1196371 [Mycena capillaripes]
MIVNRVKRTSRKKRALVCRCEIRIETSTSPDSSGQTAWVLAPCRTRRNQAGLS